MFKNMTRKKLVSIILAAVVVVSAGTLVVDATLLQGALTSKVITYFIKPVPQIYRWNNKPVSIVVSVVPTVVPSPVTSEVPSDVPSTVTSVVPSTVTSDVTSPGGVSQVPSTVTSEVPSTVTSEVPSEVTSEVPSATTSAVASGVPMPDKYGPKYDIEKLKVLTREHLKDAAKEYYKKNKPKFNLNEKDKQRLMEAYYKATMR